MTRAACILLLVVLVACGQPAPPGDSGLQAVTAIPDQPSPTPAPTPARVLVTRTPVTSHCTNDEIAAIVQHMPAYRPGDGSFATLGPDGFLIDGAPFVVRGINYYPALSPWQHFPTANLITIAQDFDQLQAANVNTLRLFVWYEPLFLCPGSSGAVPNPQAFYWLDSILRLARERGFHLILVLHHLPDLIYQPLYHNPPNLLAQTAYIVTRYRDEPALLAWDLRDSGDQDYTPFSDEPAPFTRADVLDWLARTAAAVRQLDPERPITAGWRDDSEGTFPLVDFVSFQHFGDDQSLRERIAALRSLTDKPLLLVALGYSTFEIDESKQAIALRASVRAAENDSLAGWLVWTMYDFPTSVTCWPEPCASLDDERHHFGLWRVDGSRMPAANALETLAGGK